MTLYIYKMLIKNFRTIKNLEWKPNKDVNVIIGANGSGKSTMAIALDYLLNPYLQWYNKRLSEIDYYNRDMKNEIFIEVWFKDLQNFICDDSDLLLEHIDSEDKISENGDDLILITRFKGANDGRVSHTIFSNGKEYPFRQVYKGSLNYKYIEADRDPLKELSFNSNSILSKIIENDKLSESIQEIINNFNYDSSKLLMDNSEFSKTLLGLGDNFSDFDLISNDESAIGVEATELTERKTLKAFSLVCKGKNTTNYIPLKYESRGIKNLMLLISLQYLINKEGILFLEEPEQNLEPFMQRKIIKKISKSNSGQLFFTTHSIEVAKVYDFNKIFLMKEGIIKKLPQLSQIDEKFENRIEKFAKRELISGLFAKGILLVEGDSELSGLPIFSQEVVNGLEDSGIEIIKGDGKENVFKYAKFYHKCGIPCMSLVDNDSDIKELLDKYEKNDIRNMILCQPKDYEDAIVSMEIFQQCWKSLFEELVPFKKYKDDYMKPFLSKESKSDLLKRKYDKDVHGKAKTLDELTNLLDESEIRDFQIEFIHINLAGIIKAKYVATYLIEKAYEDDSNNKVPITFSNIFRLVGVYIGNKNICANSDKCIVNKIKNKDVECCDFCEKCACIKSGYKNVLQIKGDLE